MKSLNVPEVVDGIDVDLAARRRAGRLRPRQIIKDGGGATAVEMAIALPIILLLIFGVIEIGIMMWTQLTLNNAVEAAARCGAVNTQTCGTPTSIESYAVSQAVGIPNLTSANFVVHKSGSASCGTAGVEVTASYDFTSMQRIVPISVTITASSCYPI
jgi:Flp pilus assembly protein TadG